MANKCLPGKQLLNGEVCVFH